MEAAEKFNKIRIYEVKNKEITKKIQELNREVNTLKIERNSNYNTIYKKGELNIGIKKDRVGVTFRKRF